MLRHLSLLQHSYHHEEGNGTVKSKGHQGVWYVVCRQQVRYGGDFVLSEEKKKILEEAEEYIDNHMGYRYLNRSRTEELYEQQFTKLLQEKEETLK